MFLAPAEFLQHTGCHGYELRANREKPKTKQRKTIQTPRRLIAGSFSCTALRAVISNKLVQLRTTSVKSCLIGSSEYHFTRLHVYRHPCDWIRSTNWLLRLWQHSRHLQLWHVAPLYPVPAQSQEKEDHVWEQRPAFSQKLGRHLKRRKPKQKDTSAR